MIAGVFVGQSKPTNAFDFVEQFVAEIHEIWEGGGGGSY